MATQPFQPTIVISDMPSNECIVLAGSSLDVGYTLQIVPPVPTHRCPVHGDIVEVTTFTVAGKEVAAHCAFCYFDFLAKNLPPLEKLPEGAKP